MLANSRRRSVLCLTHLAKSRQRRAILQSVVAASGRPSFQCTCTASFSTSESLESLSLKLLKDCRNNKPNVKELEGLLERWEQRLQEAAANKGGLESSDDDLHYDVERMDEIFREWIQHESHQNRGLTVLQQNRSNRPFQIMLKAYSYYVPNGMETLRVMDAWNDAFSGDLELSPTRADYEAILQAFWSQKANRDKNYDPIQAADHVNHVVETLTEWSYTMKPGIRTYQLAIQCIADAFKFSCTKKKSEIGRDVVHQLRTKLTKNVGNLLEITDVDSVEDVSLFVVGLCDALQCAPFVAIPQWIVWYNRWHGLVVDNKKLLIPCVMKNRFRFRNTLSAIQKAASEIKDRSLRERLVAEPLIAIDDFNVDDALSNLQYYTALRQQSDKELANNLLKKLEERHGRRIRVADTRDWNILMHSNILCNKVDRALEIWNEMTRSKRIKRDSYSFQYALLALSQKASRAAALQAQSILRKSVEMPPERRVFQPNGLHFAWVMKSWSKSGHPKAWMHCMTVFEWLLQESQARGHSPEIKPDGVHSGLLLSTLRDVTDPEAMSLSLSLVEGLMRDKSMEIDPTLRSIMLSVLAGTKSLKGATLAEELLADQVRHAEDNHQILLYDFNSTIRAWANSGASNAPEKCAALLRRLDNLYQKSGQDPALLPDTGTYRGMALVWANSDRPNAGEEAEKELNRMEAAAKSGLSPPPDRFLYTTVMNALWRKVKNNNVNKSSIFYDVERLYKKMIETYKNGHFAAKPDAFSTGTMLKAYSVSPAPNKASLAWNLLQEMVESFNDGDLEMKPSVLDFNAMFMICSFSDADAAIKAEAVRIALMTLNAMQEIGVAPDESSFAMILRTIGANVEDHEERTHMAGLIFQQCSRQGCVGPDVLESLRRFFPAMYEKIPVNPDNGELQLLDSWTRCVSSSTEQVPSDAPRQQHDNVQQHDGQRQ